MCARFSVPARRSSDLLDVLSSESLFSAELLRRQPLEEIRRGLIPLLFKELFENRFLVRTAVQDEQHALHRQAGRGRSTVKFWPSQGMRVAFETVTPIEIAEYRASHQRPAIRRCGSTWSPANVRATTLTWRSESSRRNRNGRTEMCSSRPFSAEGHALHSKPA